MRLNVLINAGGIVLSGAVELFSI